MGSFIIIILGCIILYLYFKNKDLKEINKIKDEKLTGELTIKILGGIEKVNYVDGIREGECKTYIGDRLYSITNYKNGKEDGKYTRYANNGNIIEQGKNVNGFSKGIWVEYYDDGSLKSKINHDKSPSEIIVEYYENGNLKAETKDNVFCKYFENESLSYIKETKYENSYKKLLTTEKYFNRNNILIKEYTTSYQGHSKDKILEILYYDNGNTKSIGSYFASGGKFGIWKYFFYNGNIYQEGEYQQNNKIGVWKTFFNENNLAEKANYFRNKKNGEYKSFYKNGNIKDEGKYQENSKIGIWKCYYENENIKEEGEYKFWDRKVGIWKYYDENGILKEEINHPDE